MALLIILSLSSLLLKEKKMMAIIFGLILLSPIIFMRNVWLAPISFGLFWFGFLRIKREQRNRLKISIRAFLRYGFTFYFLAFSLLISSFYYFSPRLEKDNLQEEILGYVEKQIDFVAPKIVPMVVGNLGKKSRDPSVAPLSQDELEQQTTNLLKEKISLFLSANPYWQFVPFGLALGLFLSLNAFIPLFLWLTIGIVYVIIKMLVKVKIIEVKKVECEREEIRI